MKPTPDDEQGLDRTRLPLSVEGVLGALLMALLCLITFANVLTRYLTNVSLAITEEFSVVMMVMLALLGAGAAFAKGGHLRMGFAADQLPARWRLGLEALVLLLGAVLFGLLVWFGVRLTWDEYRYEVSSSGLGAPQWLYTMWLPLLSLWVVLRIGGRVMRVMQAMKALRTTSPSAASAADGPPDGRAGR